MTVNRDRVRDALGAASLVTAHQTHSAAALFVDAPWGGAPATADALVTDRPGLAVGALAADCMTVLFREPGAGLVAAAHAGWRGSLAGVLEATVERLAEHGADRARIACAFGPCLRAESFEVEDDLIEAVTSAHPEAERFFLPARRRGKHLYDHVGFGRWRLVAAGVAPSRIDDVGGDTLSRQSGCFSYRASRRDGAPDYGRNLSAICLPAQS